MHFNLEQLVRKKLHNQLLSPVLRTLKPLNQLVIFPLYCIHLTVVFILYYYQESSIRLVMTPCSTLWVSWSDLIVLSAD